MVSMLGWIATLSLVLGWWHLGRKVSFSPIKIAKAFGAPILDQAESNSEATLLLKAIRKQEIRYGAIDTVSAQLLLRTPLREKRTWA